MSRLPIVFFLGCICQHSFSQDPCVRGWELVQKLNATHLEPRVLDDSLSTNLFDEFFLTLDPDAMYFTRKDLAGLGGFRIHLDEELNSSRCTFLPAAEKLYVARLNRYKAFADSLLRRPLNFKEGEFAPSINAGQPAFAETDGLLKDRWTKELKEELLGKLYVHEKKGAVATPMEEADIVNRVRESNVRAVERLLAGEVTKHIEACFLKSIARIYDPHTEFFSEDEMRAFEESINPEALSFGMEFEDSRLGEVRVTRLAPGGPAWHSGEIYQGDIVTMVEFGKEEYNVRDLDAYSLSTLLSLPDKTSATFTLRRADGEEQKVSLTKAKIENTGNLISGFLLKGKRTFGYISLPSFYTVSENEGNSGCANDVAKEILKLTAEKIEGLILDLRFNGGGSMKEAIDLAGIFVDAGPLAVVEMRDEPAFTLKDMNRGVAFGGPLVVMISRASASASELVAAALQDYQRAIIIGSSSYGKATGQLILPVNERTPKPSYIKVTQERLFRITGSSLQQTGVQADYHLPNLMDVLVPGEKAQRHSLAPRNTTKKTYYKAYTPWFPAGSTILVDASRNRVASSPDFKAVSELAAALTKPVPLGKAGFRKFFDNIEALNTIVEMEPGTAPFEVKNTAASEKLFKVDVYHQQINENQIDDIRKSIYIREVYHILEDILNSGK
jgi:carboxyl-terminal processing protease